MRELIMSLMEQYGYPGIFFLIAVENIFPPIPSEIILPFGGFLTTYTRLSIFGVVFLPWALWPGHWCFTEWDGF